jgi:hypothetical protein
MQILEDYQRRPDIAYLTECLLQACKSGAGADYTAALKSIQESERTWMAALQVFLSLVTRAEAGVSGLCAEYMRDQLMENARWGTHAVPIELEKVKALKRRVEQGDKLARKLVDGWSAEDARRFAVERMHKSLRRQVQTIGTFGGSSWGGLGKAAQSQGPGGKDEGESDEEETFDDGSDMGRLGHTGFSRGGATFVSNRGIAGSSGEPSGERNAFTGIGRTVGMQRSDGEGLNESLGETGGFPSALRKDFLNRGHSAAEQNGTWEEESGSEPPPFPPAPPTRELSYDHLCAFSDEDEEYADTESLLSETDTGEEATADADNLKLVEELCKKLAIPFERAEVDQDDEAELAAERLMVSQVD